MLIPIQSLPKLSNRDSIYVLWAFTIIPRVELKLWLPKKINKSINYLLYAFSCYVLLAEHKLLKSMESKIKWVIHKR